MFFSVFSFIEFSILCIKSFSKFSKLSFISSKSNFIFFPKNLFCSFKSFILEFEFVEGFKLNEEFGSGDSKFNEYFLESAEEFVNHLMKVALDRGAPDNITAVAVTI